MVYERCLRNGWRQFCHQKIAGEVNRVFEPFNVLELGMVFSSVKSCTTTGYDDILPELLKNMNPKANACGGFRGEAPATFGRRTEDVTHSQFS